MFKFHFLFCLIFVTFYSISQNINPIEIDRPDQTECPSIVPAGMFQMENGFNFEKTDSNSNLFLLPSSLLKIGINKNLELRMIAEFKIENSNYEHDVGLNPIYFGLKFRICEEHGILPKTSIIGHVLVPNFASEKYKARYSVPKFRFTMQHTLSKTISLGYNLGVEWDSETYKKTFVYTLTTSYKLTEKYGLYTEIYGFTPQQENPDHRVDGGLTYLISNNIIADISGGFGISQNSPKHYISLGFSFRI